MSDMVPPMTGSPADVRNPHGAALSWADRMTALSAGFGTRARGFLWRPEPRFPGSVVAGRQLMAGNFRFGGALIDAPETSPWTLSAPNEAFSDALHGFTWLGDLAALPKAEGRTQGSGLGDGLGAALRARIGAGWTPDLTGRRQIRWISHALFLLNGMSRADSRLFTAPWGGRRPSCSPGGSTRPPALPGSRR
jgi:uncharacterized heparinase superfamily protein